MDEKLKPCPFCGGEASVGTCQTSDTEFLRLNGLKDDHTFYSVNCITCGTNNRGICYGYKTKAEAIEHWNTRKWPSKITGEEVKIAKRGIPILNPLIDVDQQLASNLNKLLNLEVEE
jgi:Lar family restriction alleviation protein